MTIQVVLLQVSPDLGGSESEGWGCVGPAGGGIDGHQISYIRHDGGGKFGQKIFMSLAQLSLASAATHGV